MSSVSSPYGFQPISHQSGTPRNVRMPNGIASGYGTQISKWQPITLNAGTGLLQAVTANNQQIFGIFAGVEYTPLGGRPTESNFWPAGAVVDATQDFLVYFWPAWDPSLRLKVQADGTVAQALMGSQFNASNFGNASLGLSNATVAHAGVAGSSQGQFFLSEFDTDINSTPGDAFTDLIVGVAYPQIGAGFQPSIG